ncbi:putative ribonuclease H-like domain-containing protein [Tanacetum coccineum]
MKDLGEAAFILGIKIYRDMGSSIYSWKQHLQESLRFDQEVVKSHCVLLLSFIYKLRFAPAGLHAQVTTVRTDKGTEFLNKTLHAYFAKEGIRHETLTARTPEQNGVVKRRNRTLVEAARTMLSAIKVPLFF